MDQRRERHLTKSEAFRILSAKIERQKRARLRAERLQREERLLYICALTTGGLLAALLLFTSI